MYHYKNLVVWQKADDLAFQVYRVTRDFPREELYGMVSQIRRAVLSVPTNIAEGTARCSKAETRQFMNIALGSLSEVGYLLHFAKRLGLLNETDYAQLVGRREEVGSLLWKFHKSLQPEPGRQPNA